PGTIATAPDLSGLSADSFTSNRRPALRLLSSGPWHAEQMSEKMGRMSRLKSIFAGEDGRVFALLAAAAELRKRSPASGPASHPVRQRPPEKLQVIILAMMRRRKTTNTLLRMVVKNRSNSRAAQGL